MKLRDLVPWATGKESVPVTHDQDKDPFTALQRQVNDVINGFYRGFDMEPFGGFGAVFTPGVNVLETDTEIKVTAELPGMDEKDIDLSLTKDTLTIKGKKESEKEDKWQRYYRMERTYGSFIRTIELPCRVDDAKVEAEFKKGVLTVRLPKSPEAVKDTKKVLVKAE